MSVPPERVLVVQTAFLGDVILSIPLLKSLKYKYPQSELTLLCRKGFGEFFERTKLVNSTIEIDKAEAGSFKKGFQLAYLKKWDLIVSPHRSFRSALWVWRLRPKVSIGFSDIWNSFAYSKKIKRPIELHDVLRQLSLLEGLGIRWSDLPDEIIKVEVEISPTPQFERFRGAVAMAPGSQWNTKRWTADGFIEVARNLQAQGRKIILLGSQTEKSLCDKIASALHDPVENLCGSTTVYQLAQILREVELLLSNDSGTMHVATAVGTPVVAIFGPTVQAQGFVPWSKQSKVIEVNLPCRPCGAHGHDKCPLGTHDCMKKVIPEMVLDAVNGFFV